MATFTCDLGLKGWLPSVDCTNMVGYPAELINLPTNVPVYLNFNRYEIIGTAEIDKFGIATIEFDYELPHGFFSSLLTHGTRSVPVMDGPEKDYFEIDCVSYGSRILK